MRFSPVDFFRAMRASTPRSMRGSVLGIDIGTFSVKVVQLALRDGKPALETYGEIALSRYGASTIPGSAQRQPEVEADALADLVHEIGVTTRRGGLAISQAAALTAVAEVPKRDEDQTRKIIGVEARRFIPVPMSAVTLDWVVIPDGSTGAHAFDQLQDADGITALKQKILIIASDKSAVAARMKAARLANVEPDFFEIEMFSTIRACTPRVSEPTLVIDMGASTTKIYIADERGMPIAAHVISAGGNALTDAIASSLGWDGTRAESVKCEHGWQEGGGALKKEREKIIKAVSNHVGDTFDVARGMIDAHAQTHARRIARVIVSGGGADLYVPEIREHIRKKFSLEVGLSEPFSLVQTPLILDDAIRRFGPRYTVAVGLALRALL